MITYINILWDYTEVNTTIFKEQHSALPNKSVIKQNLLITVEETGKSVTENFLPVLDVSHRFMPSFGGTRPCGMCCLLKLRITNHV